MTAPLQFLWRLKAGAAAVVVLALLLALPSPRSSEAQTPTFSGSLPSGGGIGLLTTTAPTSPGNLVAALQDAGCSTNSVSVPLSGRITPYIHGAPSVVNAGLPTSLPTGTPFFVRCDTDADGDPDVPATLAPGTEDLFCVPTDGFIGWRYDPPRHYGVDVWTVEEGTLAPGQPGNAIFLPYPGTLIHVYQQNGVAQGFQFRHEFHGDTIYSDYFHMADWDATTAGETAGSFINGDLALNQTYERGTLLGYQGDTWYDSGNDRITHLHVAIRLTRTSTPVDPGPYFGLQFAGGTLGGREPISATCEGEPQPARPRDLFQAYTDGEGVAAGGRFSERSVQLSGFVAHSGGEIVRLQVELRRLDDFGGAFNEHAGGLKQSEYVSSGSRAAVDVHGLVDGNYQWRARTCATSDDCSEWVDAGNPVGQADFSVGEEQAKAPDLLIVLSGAPSGVTPGESVQMRVAVAATGGDLEGGTYVYARVHGSTDTHLDSDDPILWESHNGKPDFPVSVINSGGAPEVIATLSGIPSGAGGTYYLIAVVDPTNFYDESDEDNNVSIVSVQRTGTSPAPITIGVSYRCHVAINGWLSEVDDGSTCGTTGQERQMEAFKVSLEGDSSGISVRYECHVANGGWRSEVSDGQTCGTVGNGWQLEAFRIRLAGAPPGTHIQYRAHVADAGWQGWKCDGAMAGTTGERRRVEAIQIRIVNAC